MAPKSVLKQGQDLDVKKNNQRNPLRHYVLCIGDLTLMPPSRFRAVLPQAFSLAQVSESHLALAFDSALPRRAHVQRFRGRGLPSSDGEEGAHERQ